MAAHGLQTRKARQLNRLAHALHLVAVLTQCVQKARVIQIQLVQIIQIDVQLGANVFYLARQRIK